jgi:Protein of unknown function DUF124.
MQAQIKGTTLPVLEMLLNPGDRLVAEAGELSWITQTIQVATTTQTGGANGMMGVLKRAVGGGGIFMSIQPYLPSPDSGGNSGLGGTIGGLLGGN